MREVPGITGYSEFAPRFCEVGESIDFRDLHACILHLLPETRAKVLDLGYGTGRCLRLGASPWPGGSGQPLLPCQRCGHRCARRHGESRSRVAPRGPTQRVAKQDTRYLDSLGLPEEGRSGRSRSTDEQRRTAGTRGRVSPRTPGSAEAVATRVRHALGKAGECRRARPRDFESLGPLAS